MQSYAYYLVEEYSSKLDKQGIDYLQRIMQSGKLWYLTSVAAWYFNDSYERLNEILKSLMLPPLE